MRRLILAVLLMTPVLIVGTAGNGWTQKAEVDPQTLEASLLWLTVMDAGLYDEGWAKAHPLFQQKMNRDEWIAQMKTERMPLGEVTSREVYDTGYFGNIPNYPGLEMMVIQFQSSFKNKERAIETISPVRMKGGPWRVGGYAIADTVDFKVQ